MRFWDASAVLPLVAREVETERMIAEYRADPALAIWCLTPIEVWSGIARQRRHEKLRSPDVRDARRLLRLLGTRWVEIEDMKAVRSRAERLLDVHSLRAADALQLAAALVLVRDTPAGFAFVSLDVRLAECAEREGFDIIPDDIIPS
jgi:predicted nucleic acid-binding protein